MIASREQTLPFQTKIFLTVFLVALVPVFLCFAMLLPALVSTSAAGQRDAANEQLALLTGRMEHVLSSMKTALDELAEDERILPALSKQDRVQPRELYAALVERAAGMPEVSQLMLVDESGSMASSDRISTARAAALVLHDFCRSLGLPVIVYGHSTGYDDVELYAYAEFDRLNGKDNYRITDMSARWGNRDGAALR